MGGDEDVVGDFLVGCILSIQGYVGIVIDVFMFQNFLLG